MMTNPREETLTDKIATVIQSGQTARKTSHEIADEVRWLLISNEGYPLWKQEWARRYTRLSARLETFFRRVLRF